MTINKAMNISLTGLNANQAALNVVSHNIANMNTEGYVRQRVNFAEMRTPQTGNTIHAQIASLSGVKISSITNFANDYLNSYYRTQNSKYEGMQSEADTLNALSNLMDELGGTGLGDSLSAFYSAANALNQNPTDYSLRVNFAQKATAVAHKFNSMSGSIEGLKTSKVGDGTAESAATSEVGMGIKELATKLDSLANVNKQILINSSDASLTTTRDQILSEISGMANVKIDITSRGTASVSLDGVDLVKGGDVVGNIDYMPNGRITITDLDDNVRDVTSGLTGGKLGGILNGIAAIDEASGKLDTLAKAFADKMNEIQTVANGDVKPCYYDRANDELVESDATNPLFMSTDGSDITAANIIINPNIISDPDKIAAARLDTTEPNWEKSVGNGDNALLFYGSQTEKIADLGYLTFSDYMIAMSTKPALEAATKQADADAQGAVVEGIGNQILSETGVNLDEELSNMIMYKQAYNASARVFSTCVEVYDKLITLGQ